MRDFKEARKLYSKKETRSQLTEDELKMVREHYRKYSAEHKEEGKKRCQKWYAEHREEDLKRRRRDYHNNIEREKATSRVYRQKNREKLIDGNRKYYYAHQEECKKSCRDRYREHREERLAHSKEYQERRKEWYKKYKDEYYQKNRERILKKAYDNYYASKLAQRFGFDNFGNFWFDERLKALERDGNKCRICGSKENLECHHIDLFWHSFNHSADNLITLCHSCHKATESIARKQHPDWYKVGLVNRRNYIGRVQKL